ncbi:MAG: ComEC/Rec2 family competence protein [Thermoleophilia bacterium]|nr:ComEC/Rec2 family competence protein [Thermoleophilia bacterium]
MWTHLVDWFVRRAGLARFTTLSAALGVALSALAGAQPGVALAGLTVAVTGAIVATARTHVHRPGVRVSGLLVVSVLLMGLFAGYLAGGIRVAALTSSALQSRIGCIIEAGLVITGEVRSNAGWQSAPAVVRHLGGHRGPVIDQDPALGETVLLEVAPEESAAQLELGQGLIVACRVVVRAPEGPSASGYDQARRLRHQGIEVVLRAQGADSIVVLGRRGGVAGWFDELRSSAKAHLSMGPDARVSETLKGLVLGDTSGIDEAWLEAFRRAGTAHMFAVSGLHVGSIAAMMIGLARLLGAARWVGFLLAAVSALLMIPFTGASPSIVRAAVMIVVVAMGQWVGRGRDQWQVLALAAVVILVMNPFALFDAGFQLSFGAVAGIVALVRPIERLLRRLPVGARSNMAVSLAASMGTAPISLAVFGRTSLVSPLANLLVVPLLPVTMVLGMASAFLGFVWQGLSRALDALASPPLVWTILVSRLCAGAPVLQTASLGRALFALAVGAAVLPVSLAFCGRLVRPPLGLPLPFFRRCVVWVWVHRPRGRRGGAALGVGLILLGLVLGATAYPGVVRGVEALQGLGPGRGWPDHTEIRILDVGQGNAALVRTSGRHALLFDGGPAGCDLAGQLRDLGVRTLDLVVISHPHADHFAGLLESLGSLEVKTLVDQVEVAAAPASDSGEVGAAGREDGAEAVKYLELRRELASDGCGYVFGCTGCSIKVDDVVVRLYAPADPLTIVDGPDPWAAEYGPPSGDELNGASVVALVSVGGTDVLLPGDAEAEVLSRYQLPQAEMVVVPHHGSGGAVSARLLQDLRPKVAIISVGEENSFGHPHAGTISTLREAVGTVLRTDTSGWVSCELNEDTMLITSEREPTR